MMRRIDAPPDFNPFDFNFLYGGLLIGTQPGFRRTSLTSDLLFTDAQTELNILVTALRLLGIQPSAVRKGESPDFEIHMLDFSVFFAEITTVIEPIEAKADTKIAELSHLLHKWVISSLQLSAKTKDLAITFFIPFPPRDRDEQNVLQNLKDFVMNDDLAARLGAPITSIGPQYAHLQSLGCKILVLKGSSFVQVSRGAMAIAPPQVGAAQVIRRIEAKAQLAQKWPERPLWLILWLTAMYSYPKAIMDEISSIYRPDFAASPFEKIVIGDGHTILEYKREDA